MVISVGCATQISRLIPEVAGSLGGPVMTLERARVLKRDGGAVASLEHVPDADEHGMNLWQS